jgi:hypothetical protein
VRSRSHPRLSLGFSIATYRSNSPLYREVAHSIVPRAAEEISPPTFPPDPFTLADRKVHGGVGCAQCALVPEQVVTMPQPRKACRPVGMQPAAEGLVTEARPLLHRRKESEGKNSKGAARKQVCKSKWRLEAARG